MRLDSLKNEMNKMKINKMLHFLTAMRRKYKLELP